MINMSDSSAAHASQPVPTRIDASLLATRPWVASYEQGIPAELEIPDQPLTWLLDQTVRQYPRQTAIIYYGTKISYAQLSTYTNRFAIGLQRLGIQKGDRVALALPNIPQFLIAFYGALKAGAVVVPTNPLYTERELQHQLHDAGAKYLVMLDQFYPVARAIRAQIDVEQIILTSAGDFLPPLLKMLFPLSQKKAKLPQPQITSKELQADNTLHSMAEMLELRSHSGIEVFHLPVKTSAEDLAVLQYTGGTTGLAKGAMLTHRNLLANAMQCAHWTPKTQVATEVCLCVAPFFHVYGLTVGINLSIYSAATMVLLPKFSPKEVLNAISRYRPTLFPGIPTMYKALLKVIGGRTELVNSIRYCISGAAPLPAALQKEFEDLTGGKLVEGYGLSETSPVTHCNPCTDKCVNGTVGIPLPNVEAKIINPETGQSVPVGETGELLVKGPNVMRGYWNRPDETAQVLHDGWLHTGDLCTMDEMGYFRVVDRSKDLILASGFNVYPREVEEVLSGHPAIEEVAVVGVNDEYRGETVAAVLVLKPDYTASDELRAEIVAYCKHELTAYKVPKIIEFRDKLPRSLIMKVLKRELRNELQTQMQQRVK